MKEKEKLLTDPVDCAKERAAFTYIVCNTWTGANPNYISDKQKKNINLKDLRSAGLNYQSFNCTEPFIIN